MLQSAPHDSAHQHSQSLSSSTSTLSPALSMFSRGHSSWSSVSSTSTTTSPLPPRDSFDLYGSARKLEDVREEPQEREEEWIGGDDSTKFAGTKYLILVSRTILLTFMIVDPTHVMQYSSYPTSLPLQAEYSLGDQDTWSTTSSGHHHFKRQRSTDHRHSLTDRVASRFGSISRKWKTRSIVPPQLSIVTQSAMPQRSGSATSSCIVSPALSAISKHESHLPTSPIAIAMNENWNDSAVVPLFIEGDLPHEEQEEQQGDQEQGQATTPLLPPMMAELSKKHDTPLQSPLQSPSIAPTPCIGSSRVSIDGATTLPSPPLSTRPSMASIQRSRGDTVTSLLPVDIPYMTLHEETADPWDARLGHANFFIYPEPYAPTNVDLDSYKEFRANWEHARKQYAQHIARTMENYGQTSRVYILTQEKWNGIDDEWKRQDKYLSTALLPVLARLSDEVEGTPDSPASMHVLEQPITRIVVPPFDKSGKFPEIGDADIVGPMFVGPAKAVELQRRAPSTPPQSPKKRNLFKYLSDVLGRNNLNR
jgi:hypothetical protein